VVPSSPPIFRLRYGLRTAEVEAVEGLVLRATVHQVQAMPRQISEKAIGARGEEEARRYGHGYIRE